MSLYYYIYISLDKISRRISHRRQRGKGVGPRIPRTIIIIIIVITTATGPVPSRPVPSHPTTVTTPGGTTICEYIIMRVYIL